jgi:hypothetical protein
MRETGRSYGAVAASVGLKRANDAHAVFVRAVRALPEGERAEMVQRESGRLDRLEARIRTRDEAQPAKMMRRLEAVEVLRQSLR